MKTICLSLILQKISGEGLARVACVGEVDGEVVDLRTVIDKDCELNILTFDSDEGKTRIPSYSIPYFSSGSKTFISRNKNLRSDLLSTMVSTMIWRKILHLHRKTLRRLKKKK